MTVIKVQRNEIQQRVINVDTLIHTYIYTVSMARSESCTLQSHQKLHQSSSISTTTTSNVQQNTTKEEKNNFSENQNDRRLKAQRNTEGRNEANQWTIVAFVIYEQQSEIYLLK